MEAVVEPQELMRISWGPQHPMSGQTRFLIDTDGERVSRIIPDAGFTHRGIEKILENRSVFQGVVPVERMVMADAANVGLGYVRAVEQLMDIEPPKRAQYIRTLLCEISRINSHLYAFGLLAESGGGYPAVFLWSTADRELFLDLAEMLTGARWSFNFSVPGGVMGDIPEGFEEKASKTLDYLEERLKVYEEAWLDNLLWEKRSKGVGVLRSQDAVRLAAAGPSLRGSGVAMDVRKDDSYNAYDEVDFEVVTRPEGDSFARLSVRAEEMSQSVQIIRQVLKNLPPGPLRKKVPWRGRIPTGETYARVETARGELGVHMISTGGDRPYRVKIASPTLRNLYVISQMPQFGEVLIADLPVVIYSFDPWYLDSDR